MLNDEMTCAEALAELRAVGYLPRQWTRSGLTTIYLNDGTDERIWAHRYMVQARDVWTAVAKAVGA